MHCPSCGSVVDDSATTCPVCGEALAETSEATPNVERPAPERAASTVMTSAGEHVDAPSATRVTCPECGATNPRGAIECSTCGASLEGADRPVSHAAPARATPAEGKGSLQTYLIAGLAMVVIALVIYIVSTPAEKTGPPQAGMPGGAAGAPGANGAAAGGALPPNHPPIDESAQTAALEKLVTELKGKVAAQPTNDSLQLALANALYDVGRHPEAKQHYAEYLRKHPQDLDVATDFATSVAAAGNVDSAVTVLNTVLAKDPKHQRAAFNMAIMYRQKEKRDSIVYWLERVAAIDSTTPTGKGALDILKEFKSVGAHPAPPSSPSAP